MSTFINARDKFGRLHRAVRGYGGGMVWEATNENGNCRSTLTYARPEQGIAVPEGWKGVPLDGTAIAAKYGNF